MLQQGYAFGYLLAVVFARGLVGTTSHGWRPLYWFGACPPVLIIAFRLCLPETKTYRERATVRQANGSVASTFVAEGKIAFKRHWLLLIYLVLLMAGFNFMVMTSPDYLYTILMYSSLTARKTCIRPCYQISTTSPPTRLLSLRSLPISEL